MRIASVRIANFLSYGEREATFDELGDVNLIVGPNGSGKTNLFRALEYVGHALTGSAAPLHSYVHRLDDKRVVSIDVVVRLNKDEAAAATATALYGLANQVASKGGDMHANRRIASVIWQSDKLFAPLFETPLRFSLRSSLAHDRLVDAFVQLDCPGGGTFLLTSHDLSIGGLPSGRHVVSYLGYNIEDEILKRMKASAPDLFAIENQYRPLPPTVISGISSQLTAQWLHEELTPPEGAMKSMHLGPELPRTWNEPWLGTQTPPFIDLLAFLEDRGGIPESFTLFSLLSRIYQTSAIRLSDERLKVFSLATNGTGNGGASSGSFTGFSLAQDLLSIKVSPDVRARRSFFQLQEAFKTLTGGLSFDAVQESIAVPDPSQEGKTSTRDVAAVYFEDETFSYRSDQAAAGYCELLLVLTVAAASSDSVLLLDEPALNLHPSKQRELYSTIVMLAKQARNQLFVITHSPAFISAEDLEGAFRLSMESGTTAIHQLRVNEEKERNRLSKLVRTNPSILGALFARRVILVEGEQEELALPVWFSKCANSVDPATRGVLFLNVHGKAGFAGYGRIMDAWGIPHIMVGDGDSQSSLETLGKQAITYRQTDFPLLLKELCPTDFDEAKRTLCLKDDDPFLARTLALNTAPPQAIEDLWAKLRPFVDGA